MNWELKTSVFDVLEAKQLWVVQNVLSRIYIRAALFRLRGNRAEVRVPVTALLVFQFHPAGQQRSRPAVEERRHAEDGAGRQGRSTWGSASSCCGDPGWTGQVGGLSAGGRHLPGAAAVHSDTSSDTVHCGVNSCAQFICLSAS